MTSSVFLRYEILRTFRNWRFVVLALAWPLALYLSIAVTLILLYTGWRGWEMVYRDHVAISDEPM